MELVANTVNGVLSLNKPVGMSSNYALSKIKHLYPREKRPKVGHAGTLDPFATGVLLVLLGKATKQFDALTGQEKRYLATIKLGATTQTLDLMTEEIPDASGTVPSEQQVCDAIPAFVGRLMQVPPIYSALKHKGKPLYVHAIRGKEVELEARPVHVYGIELVRYAYPELVLDIRCGRGTYIRCLARDIAQYLGTTGYLTSLCRTAVGPYTLERAHTLEGLTAERISQILQAP